jgi:hypothetical protein
MQLRVVALILVGGCGDAPASVDAAPLPRPDSPVQTGSGTIMGTVRGAPVAVADVASSVAHGGNGNTFAGVFLSTAPDICMDVAARVKRAGSTLFFISLVDATSMTASVPSAPGTYAIQSTPSGLSSLLGSLPYDAGCNVIAAQQVKATSGTVTLTSIVGDVFAGTFDVTLDTGDRITGTFAPGGCRALDEVAAPTTCL